MLRIIKPPLFFTHLRPLWEYGVQILFPAWCMTCRAPVARMGSLCTDCFQQLHALHAPECNKCGEPFAYDMRMNAEEEVLCDTCHTHPPHYDKAQALWAYDEISSAIIKQFKFADKTQLAPYLGALLSHRVRDLLIQSDIISPVPLHPKRLRERRYNQSALLASHLHHHARTHYADHAPLLMQHLLKRTYYTAPQTALPFHARQQNVANAFRVHPRHVSQLQGKTILLIDDVLTTGATVNACADALREAGASRILVATLTKRLKEEEEL